MEIKMKERPRAGYKSVREQVHIYVDVINYMNEHDCSQNAAAIALFRKYGYLSVQGLLGVVLRVRKMIAAGAVVLGEKDLKNN